MRIAAILASLLVLLLSGIWLTYKPGLDSAVAVAAALAALISSFFLKRNNGTEDQAQQVSGSSIGIQAGRDAKVENMKNK